MDPRSAMPSPSRVVCPDSTFDCLPQFAFLFVTFNTLNAAYQSRRDLKSVVFVTFAYANLLMIFFCLRRLEKMAPDDPPEHKNRTLAAVWILFTALNLAFAWRAAEILPPLLAVAMAGFYVLIIYPRADGCSDRSMIPSADQNV
ncbi:unnamed protein product [Musa hybrid cultivar]